MDHPTLPENSLSYWNDTSTLSRFPTLEDHLKVDIGIVGAGLTGLTTAYLLANQGLSVCIIDAAAISSGTTAHTTAKITAQHGLIYNELIEHVGSERASLYYNANERAIRFIKDIIDTHQIACEYTDDDAFLYTKSDQDIEKIESEYKAYEKLGIPGELTTETSLPFDIKRALKMPNQAHFHPLKYTEHLLRLCQQAGVQIFEHTRAINIEYNKHPAIITENKQRIISRYVIEASHYPFYDGLGFYPTRMYASRSYLLAIQLKKPVEKGMFINTESPTRSVRPLKINEKYYQIIGGESHKTGQSTESMLNHYQTLEQFAKTHFQVDNIMYRWSAQDYITLDKIPYIGPITEKQRNVLVATGFRKWGMTNATNAALIFRDIILERENPYQELFSPSRQLKADPSIKKLISYNTDVAKHLIKGKITPQTADIKNLQPNDAVITKQDGRQIGVYKGSHGEIYKVDTTCTHMGCEVVWNNAEKSWDCPCHGSRYHYDGSVLNGPAVKPLQQITEP